MVGITLSSEQIRNAPREVRQWLEQQVLASFGWQSPAPAAETRLAACSAEDAFKALALIRDMIPVVNVFFELGHPGLAAGDQGLEAFRLADIQRHVRLANTQQVAACLQIINDALRRVRNETESAFYGLDDRGHCFITTQTRQSIARVWQQVVAERDLETAVQTAAPSTEAKAAGSSPSAGSAVGASTPYTVWSAPARPVDASVSRPL